MTAHKTRPGPAPGLEKTATLDEVKLMPGDALQLQPLVEGPQERLTVRIIGVMKPKSVLVTAPMIDGKLIFVRDGQPFLVRAFSGLNVCAFKAKVLKAQHAPFPYLHLSYPETVQLMRIRKAVRARVQIIAALYDRAGGRQIGAGRIVDLSVGGARIQVPRGFPVPGEQVYLAFKIRLDDIEEIVETSAAMRSVADEDDEEGRPATALGVQFGELNPQQRLLIMNLVYQYLLKETD
ncbi:flagellar brake protein [Parasulfuritortus cantonensis]|uniref:Flagellar brake protein n=1 Tax=Parasulfuritortus cantonensis TaxID=2528202 RepID=A0A4R1BGH8_9PROT|nr:flagellar brake protein [Parasulfuritortus cantonensis]TCJ16300.1 flagellar brake protein [Parasulfuritortus cantonensis]